MDYPLSSTYGTRFSLFLQSADDYHRQRHRTNKKLLKLRRSLNIQTKDTRNYQTKSKISSIDSEQYDSNNEFASVILFQIERDLLYAEETRLLMDVNSTSGKQKFLITKLKKALSNSEKLLSITRNEPDDFKKLELLTYTLLINGSLSILKRKYSFAIYAYSLARCSLMTLNLHQPTSSQLNKELYLQIIDTVVDPALSFATAHDSSRSNKKNTADLQSLSRTHANDSLSEKLDQALIIIKKIDPTQITPISSSKSENLITEIEWSDYKATIKSDEVSRGVTSALKEESKIIIDDPSSYDPALLNWQDVSIIHSSDMDRSNHDEDNSDENQDKFIIKTYIDYHYLLLRIRRDISLISNIELKSSKSISLTIFKDSIKILDMMLSTINQILSLQGVSHDDELTNALESLESYFKCLKVSKLAQAYLINKLLPESLALYQKSIEILSTVKNLDYFTSSKVTNLPNSDDVKLLAKQLSESLKDVHVLATYNSTSSNTLSSNDYLIDNVDNFPSLNGILSKVANINNVLVPVSVKPVVFDVAFNYISYDDDDDDDSTAVSSSGSQTSSQEEAEKKKGGFFGLFGR
ncbi:hypothetical protein CANARDRAFT_201334 [[Candida] arabinofermentans NRRL YB-2248]|uniref:Signal recognition particle subunit SRP68 n=1 Tax=[Candida] arabinofermentans NRRL YB-2248 TaxID=983967 RepID=A0A1E4SXB2_9ASCO|nr:hypothetical protein CANARDRAFT_201334 [[Candida] arabinofermentans NRRL YB-2248]